MRTAAKRDDVLRQQRRRLGVAGLDEDDAVGLRQPGLGRDRVNQQPNEAFAAELWAEEGPAVLRVAELRRCYLALERLDVGDHLAGDGVEVWYRVQDSCISSFINHRYHST